MQSQTFIRLQVLLRTTPDYLHKHSIFIISRYFSQHFFKFNLTRKFVRSYGAIIWLQKKKPIAQMSHQPQAWKVKRLAVERQILNNCFFFPLRFLMSLMSLMSLRFWLSVSSKFWTMSFPWCLRQGSCYGPSCTGKVRNKTKYPTFTFPDIDIEGNTWREAGVENCTDRSQEEWSPVEM